MSSGNPYLAEDLYDYIVSVSVREDPRLTRLRSATSELPGATMQISSDQGQFMSLLARLAAARRAIEVGVFTGYSALCIALALPDDGRLIACEINEEYAEVAHRFWEEAGAAHKIDLRIAPALETLDGLLAGGEAGTFDLGFIDADKGNYGVYFERLLQLMRPGGLIMIDNVLWGGLVLDPAQADPDTDAIRSLNQRLFVDERVDISLVPIGDGLTLVRKR
jgi:caffeoyl-CoA O-methyltransferase